MKKMRKKMKKMKKMKKRINKNKASNLILKALQSKLVIKNS